MQSTIASPPRNAVRSQAGTSIGTSMSNANKLVGEWLATGPKSNHKAILILSDDECKFIHAVDQQGCRYFCALPSAIAPTCDDIRKWLKSHTGGRIQVYGGGYLTWHGSEIDLSGSSTSFGPADHLRVARIIKGAYPQLSITGADVPLAPRIPASTQPSSLPIMQLRESKAPRQLGSDRFARAVLRAERFSSLVFSTPELLERNELLRIMRRRHDLQPLCGRELIEVARERADVMADKLRSRDALRDDVNTWFTSKTTLAFKALAAKLLRTNTDKLNARFIVWRQLRRLGESMPDASFQEITEACLKDYDQSIRTGGHMVWEKVTGKFSRII